MIVGLRSCVVLALTAASLVLFGQQLLGDSIHDFARDNLLSFVVRSRLLSWMVGAASVTALGALSYAALAGYQGITKLRRAAHVACPLMLIAFVPPLVHRDTWDALPLVIAIACFTLLLERLLRVSFTAAGELMDGNDVGGVSSRRERRVGAALVGAGAIFYAIYMSRYTIYSHRRFGTYNFDLGQYDNIFWSALHGRPLRCSPLGAFDNWSELGGHADLSIFFLLPFYAIRPNAETLLILQACILGMGAIPIYLFAIRRLPVRYGCALSFCYLLYPPMHGANFYDFHFQPLAAVFVLFTIFFVDARRWIWAIVSYVVAIGCREDTSVGLTMLGLYLWLTGYRPKAGFVMAAVSMIYFVIIRFYVMARYGPGWFSDIYKDLYPQPDGPHSYGGIIYTLSTNPIYVFRTLLTEDKLRYFLQIATPVAFLPLRRAYLLPALAPGFLFTIMTTAYPPTTDIAFQYSGHFTPYLFTACAVALAAYMGAGEAARRAAAGVALCAGTCLTTIQWGAFPPHGTIKGGFMQVGFTHPTPADEQKARDLADLAAMIPSEAMFAVSEEELPHVSGRLNVLTLRWGVGNAEYVLFGPNSQGGYIGTQALADGSFVEVARRPGLALLKRK